ncbi:hypothetical protein SUGI_0433460 [Cryptomeria japonica]|nr:hypothetical protein SUGI_0433460 [Cryptomeria japonica]
MEGDYIAFSIFFLSLLLLTFYVPRAEGQTERLVSAYYVFGDSGIDTGNNNVLPTLVRADFPPYGRDFPNGQPTGRFTNGRLVTDQLSELLGLPDLLPAYLDPAFQGQKLLTGASFGSSASGLADSTSIPMSVLPLEKQIENFRRYKEQLARLFGHETANMTVSEALFSLNSGTNDFCNNYYLNPFTRGIYTVEQLQDMLLESLSEFIWNVSREGATKLAIFSVPPFGCLPSQIALYDITGKNCVEEFNEVARSFCGI